MRSSILARIPGFRQRIIPEPRVPSRGSQARGTRLGALAKSITGYHKNMVRKQCPVLKLANQMPVRIWIWPEPLVAPRVRRALGTRMGTGGARKLVQSESKLMYEMSFQIL